MRRALPLGAQLELLRLIARAAAAGANEVGAEYGYAAIERSAWRSDSIACSSYACGR